jgi:hypothetical protein
MKFSLAIIIVALVLLTIVPAAPGQEESRRPIFRDGSFWQYRASQENWFYDRSADLIGNYEVVLENHRLRVFAIKGNEREEINQPGAYELRGMTCLVRSDWKFLDCPIQVGKTWKASTRVNLNVPAGRSSPIEIEYAVKGMEEVTTPAGTFNAFRIEGYYQRPTKEGFVQNKFVHFFNQDCQCIVKFRRQVEVGATAGAGPKREIELIKLGTSLKVE